MDKSDLESRTKLFAINVVRFVGGLPKNKISDVLGYQLLKAGTSIGANYREANRAESRKDFIHKIGIVSKEAAETQYWLELLNESFPVTCSENSKPKFLNSKSRALLNKLLAESTELVAIFTSIGKTCKKKRTDI